MRSFFHVQDFVDCQCARLTEALAAFRALEGLLLGVDVAVISQVVLPSEGLATNITVEWPLICVRPLVDQQVVGFSELALAVPADEPLLWSGRPSRSAEKTRVVRRRGRRSSGGGGIGGIC